MKILELMFGSTLMLIGYSILEIEVEINTAIQSMSALNVYNSTSIEYTNLLLTNINGMLLAFIIFSGGAYAVAISLPSVLAELYGYVLAWNRKRKRDTL